MSLHFVVEISKSFQYSNTICADKDNRFYMDLLAEDTVKNVQRFKSSANRLSVWRKSVGCIRLWGGAYQCLEVGHRRQYL